MAYPEILSPNCNNRGNNPIERLTVHCVVGEFPAATVAGWFSKPSRKASSNYIIGKNGEIVVSVPENKRAWTSGSGANDYKAITIECSSGAKSPYAFSDTVYNSLVNLTLDIMKRNGKTKLLYFANKNEALKYKPAADEMVLTYHRWFQSVECPGKWFFDRSRDFCAEINAKTGSNTVDGEKYYRVQIGAFRSQNNALKLQKELQSKGYSAIIKYD